MMLHGYPYCWGGGLQAVARGRNCRVAFLVVRELIILAQAAVRGWIERRVAAKHREVRVGELRTQVCG